MLQIDKRHFRAMRLCKSTCMMAALTIKAPRKSICTHPQQAPAMVADLEMLHRGIRTKGISEVAERCVTSRAHQKATSAAMASMSFALEY